MSYKKSKRSAFPYWKPIVPSPRDGRCSSSPSGRFYPLSQDPRYVLGDVVSPKQKSPRVFGRASVPSEATGGHVHYPELSKNLTDGLGNHRFSLEDLCIRDERKKDELARLEVSLWNPVSTKPSVSETVNKKLLREQSVADLCAIPDVFSQQPGEEKSSECLNKRLFTSGSLQDLRAISSIEAKESLSNNAYEDLGRHCDYITVSLEELRALPSFSSYYDDNLKPKELQKKISDVSTPKEPVKKTTSRTSDSEDSE